MLRLIVAVVSLLVVAAVVMLLAKQQLQAVGSVPVRPDAASSAAPPAAPLAGSPAPTMAEGAQQIQRRVADDVGRLMQQGASRASDAE